MFLAEKLSEVNEINTDLKENYFTFVVNLIRRIRFGLNNEYALSNLVCFNYLLENDAIEYDNENHIVIDYEKMKIATENLTKKIIILQGDGDYEGVKKFIDEHTFVDQTLFDIITQINDDKLPTDILINQGEDFIKF